MKFEFSRSFLLGMAAVGTLTSCGGLSSPDEWAQAPMPESAAGPVVAETPQAAPKVIAKAPVKTASPDAPEAEASESSFKRWWSGKKEEKDEKNKKEKAVAKKAPEPTPKPQEEAPSPEAAPAVKSKGGYPVAVPSKLMSGYVISPYDGKKISVKGVASGSLVADPRYPLDQKKYFVVP